MAGKKSSLLLVLSLFFTRKTLFFLSFSLSFPRSLVRPLTSPSPILLFLLSSNETKRKRSYGGGSDRYSGGGGGGHPGSFGGDRYGANANGAAAGGGPAPAPTGRDAPPHAFGPADGFSLSADEYRKKHELTVVSRGGQVPDPLQTFDSVGFSPEIMREIQRAGYAAPTPIQAQSWAVALRGSDLISIAKTGSGKTCGFLLPGFMHCAATRRDPRVGPTMAVLAPTRELAVQIKEEADKFGRSGGFRNTCCYGASMERSSGVFFFPTRPRRRGVETKSEKQKTHFFPPSSTSLPSLSPP